MKISLKGILFTLLCALLLIAALGTGAVRGWNGERAQIESALQVDGELRTQLEHRGMDAANLCVVAARHLPEDDPELLQLRAASQVLLSGTNDMDAILAADAQITEIALHFSDTLPDLASVKASERDRNYITTLTASLARRDSMTHRYTLMVEDFNSRLNSSPTGWVARLLGVEPLPVPGAAADAANEGKEAVDP